MAGPSGRDPLDALLAALLGEAAAGELGVLDEAGGDHVGGDPLRSQVESQGIGEPDHPGLGGGVGAAAPGEGRDRAQVDDAPAGPPQVGDGGPAHQERPLRLASTPSSQTRSASSSGASSSSTPIPPALLTSTAIPVPRSATTQPAARRAG